MLYATSDEYQDAVGQNATDRQLADASLAVDKALIGAIYNTDSDGLPTDPNLLAAMKRATIAQARAIISASAQTLKSASIGSASYSYADPIPNGITLPAGGGLCPDALTELQLVGLTPTGVIING